MNHLASADRARCLAVWLVGTAGCLLALAWAAPDLRADGLGAASFDTLVVRLSAAAVAACAAWAWLVTSVVVGQALAGRPRGPVPGVPAWARAAVLLACGLALTGAGGAAHADDRTARASADHGPTLDGLPFPDRAVGAVPARVRPVPAGTARVHVVQPGDTLWDLAVADLGTRAGSAAVTARWQRIHALNRAVVGADPDLIHPGQQLRMPPPPRP